MATGDANNHWLVGTSIPVILAALGVAASAGILYNSVGRIVFLEAELSDRNNYLPAHLTAERLKTLEDIKSRVSRMEATIESIQERASRLRDDLNAHRESDEAILRDQLSALRAHNKP